MELEKNLKWNEGKVWGTMIGAFGGCYAIRKTCHIPVPQNFLMDDFYISLNALKRKKRAIMNMDAKCFEDVSDKIKEEFRRKVRISAGNFQNLFAYTSLWLNPLSKTGFTFWSHKILRWITPILLLGMFISSYMLREHNAFYSFVFLAGISLILITFAEILLSKLSVNIKPLRFVTHFLGMNLALLLGFFKFLFGVRTNIWKPTERNQ